MGGDRLICVGTFLGAHGVRGLVRLASHTGEPMALFDYEPLSDATGARVFKLKYSGKNKTAFLVSIEGVADRDAAEALRGVELYVPRNSLPQGEKDAFYLADLIGLAARDVGGRTYGKIVAVHNYGAGDMIEVEPENGKSFMFPFQDAFVPLVDLEAGFLEMAIPDGWLKEEKKEDERDG